MKTNQTPTLTLLTTDRSIAKKSKLPTIGVLNVSYSQRYQHITKITNYNELSENLIWKEYQKLRICLKQLNEQVLYHMERKMYIIPSKQITKEISHKIGVIEEEKRLNEQKLGTLANELHMFEQRVTYLIGRPNAIEQMAQEAQSISLKTKQLQIQNKNIKRKHKLDGRNLENGPNLAEKITLLDQALASNLRKCTKKTALLKILQQKIKQYQQRSSQLQSAIQLRLEQFSKEDNYIGEQINFQRFQQLKTQKQNLLKYEPIYKRNYLMKLKQLEIIVNSVKKHQQIIQQTETNIINMRTQIDSISNTMPSNRKRNSSSLAMIDMKKQQKLQQAQLKNQNSFQDIINKKDNNIDHLQDLISQKDNQNVQIQLKRQNNQG